MSVASEKLCKAAAAGVLAVVLAVMSGYAVRQTSPVKAQCCVSSHPQIKLIDESGVQIDPGAENPRPYSPRRTCGACHDYEMINKAYHFQLGADVISDDYGSTIGKPWISSDGQFGRQHHMSYAWVAKKKNSSASEIGMTPYQYTQGCGACHAGGGPMERDRDGRRYDERLAQNPGLADTPDGDYYKAAWDRSGVVEIDCLMCHLRGYNAQARTDQLSKANFRWAATVGAGLGTVEGSVKDGQTPVLNYNRTLFNEDGTVTLKVAGADDANCLLCHGEAEVKKRGHVWYDSRQSDVHTSSGMKCLACHTTGKDHQIRKGDSNYVILHDELDDKTLSCEGCHLSSSQTTGPKHESIPPSHIKTIACVTCHVTEQNVAAVGTVDTTTGKAVGLPTVKGAKKYGETGSWSPAYFRLKDGKIYSGNALLPAWWGNRVGDVIHPLTLNETQKAYEQAKDIIADDNGDGKPEANTDSEIRAMLNSVRTVLQGGRFKEVSPAYVKGNRVWELKDGALVSSRHPQAEPIFWTFSHNVAPSGSAWGAGGCKDCHSKESRFFYSPVVVDPYDSDAKPVTVPMWEYCGVKKSALEVGY